jgi:adenine phosphoribosyltransferase
VEKSGGIVAGVAFLIELAELQGRDKLAPRPIFSLITY